ncbi:hypothetical protein HRI_000183900 [Hibiscus trionum]|uniref:Uncharacterized protein n=1 Tax=Hibiscus trionum TaxID=183268 RepID=A0A9W7LI45_HIBTR|nr:hypothetical protein HRI_000183900 [Hibiscus trionum]
MELMEEGYKGYEMLALHRIKRTRDPNVSLDIDLFARIDSPSQALLQQSSGTPYTTPGIRWHFIGNQDII